MNNRFVFLVLRLTHVVSGVLWVGAATMLAARGATPGPATSAPLRRYVRAMWLVVALLLVATAAMATARYL